MTDAKAVFIGLSFVLMSLPVAAAAQNTDAERNIGAPLKIEVDLNITNLADEVAGVLVSCDVESLYEIHGVVGEGKVFIHSEREYPIEKFHESEFASLPISFIPTQNVFGYGGTRSFTQKVTVLLFDPKEKFEGGNITSRIETWVKGGCWLELVGKGWDFTAEFDEFAGDLPIECSPTSGPIHICVRPGTSRESAFFTFERDFGAGTPGDGN